ncbi:MAG: cell division protein FtsH, partial [Chloroflexi bacterium]
MDKQPANIHWLQNNNKKSPQRQQNQLGPGSRPNGQTPQRGPGINRWLLIIVLVMLGIYAYSYLNPANTSNTSNRDELTYSSFYSQINDGNIKTAVFNGQTDITGQFKNPVGQYTQYHVIQLPNGDNQLPQLLLSKGAVVISQPPQDNSFWLNLLIALIPW